MIGPYQLIEVIGHGGMATVYKAYQPNLDRIVAIKVLLPAFVDDAAFRFRFQREARLIARLRHPHIVGIYGVGDDEGLPYLVMEYLQGQTLHAVLCQRRQAGNLFSPAEALDLLRPIASALDYAHTRDVIHRDLKPENIIVTANGPVITDFGLAKLVQEEAATVSVVMGTPSYMAPEQIQAEPVDRRTDVYALGILLYALLTGRVPFTGPSPFAVAQAHLSQPPPALANLQPRLASSPLLDEVARRAIAKRKSDRWPSAGAMIAALAHAVQAPPAPAGRSTAPVRRAGLAETAHARTPLAPPMRLQRPPAPDGPVGRLVLLLPLAVLLIAGLWAASVWSHHENAIASPPRIGTITSVPGPTGVPGQAAGDANRRPGTPTAGRTDQAGTVETVTATMASDTSVEGNVRAPTGAYLRSGPGLTYPQVAGLPDGAHVVATSQVDGWLEIQAETGEQGWISSPLVQILAGDVTSLPPPETPPSPPKPIFAPLPSQSGMRGAAGTQVDGHGGAIRLEDTVFTGGWRNRGASTYGGRTATWVYGQGSGYSSMSATFTAQFVNSGPATLTIEGMDSEDTAKTAMRISINGATIFDGASPFPNDDQPLQSGRWANFNFTFDSALLRLGSNTVTITNLSLGPKGLPPFVALDYAVVRLP